jgi:hypothetical protein
MRMNARLSMDAVLPRLADLSRSNVRPMHVRNQKGIAYQADWPQTIAHISHAPRGRSIGRRFEKGAIS